MKEIGVWQALCKHRGAAGGLAARADLAHDNATDQRRAAAGRSPERVLMSAYKSTGRTPHTLGARSAVLRWAAAERVPETSVTAGSSPALNWATHWRRRLSR
jgi:hypothetical protein